MRVKRIAEGALHSRGKVFNNGEWVKVDQATFNYLKRTYPDSFEFDEENKQKVVAPDVKKDVEKETKKDEEKATIKGRTKAK